MNKRISAVATLVLMVVILCTGCNYKGYDFIDNNYHFDYCYMKLPNGEIIEGKVKSWADSEGEQLTITLEDGNKYLVNSVNCVLIENNDE